MLADTQTQKSFGESSTFFAQVQEAIGKFRLPKKPDAPCAHVPASDGWLPKACLAQCHALRSQLNRGGCSIALAAWAGRGAASTCCCWPHTAHRLCTALSCQTAHQRCTWFWPRAGSLPSSSSSATTLSSYNAGLSVGCGEDVVEVLGPPHTLRVSWRSGNPRAIPSLSPSGCWKRYGEPAEGEHRNHGGGRPCYR